MGAIQRIQKRQQLTDLARTLGVRPDWHEPDEQNVDVKVHGKRFDNAGFWGTAAGWHPAERYVVIYQGGVPVAEVNLATLFAFACGLEG
jgi:hypothetical protein